MSRPIRQLLAVGSAGAFMALAVVLLFADRSVSLLGPVRRVAIRSGQRIEQTFNIDVLDRNDIPASLEQLGHAVLWGTGMVVFAWILRTRVPVVLTALAVAGTSVVFEAAQPVLSATRRFEASDAVANFAGIAAATVLVSVLITVERRAVGIARIDPTSPALRDDR